ncbi:MAG TPA: SCO family protein [Pyrinomonadaceae bacterium]
MPTKLIFKFTLAAFMTLALMPSDCCLVAAGQVQRKAPNRRTMRYACPMHPEVAAKKPGKCSKCGMALRLVNHKANEPVVASSTPGPATGDIASASSVRIPDATVYNQNGRRLNFYTDLVKGKVIAINFIFTTCTTICPPLTATFRRVQQELGEHMGRDVWLISISVDPTIDTPERLFDFAAQFKTGPGWTFVTGDKGEIDSLLQALGAAVANKNDHTPMILVGNDATGYWTRTYGLSSPATLVKVITEAMDHK